VLAYKGDDLLHDIELHFPGASYRAFFLATDARKTFCDERLSSWVKQEDS
jgi:hypothetical protein